ncbi:thioesterase II family protein [Streptomyces sp. GS7]|uniref:thioesterase II family protein n=1 Tax=Streptomyces sp. GS7 TaxID=2692234 RepID=UPI0013173661|nr:alpha/beta fold hydrolase [Streptomyces sp. GS7]QHC23462.1 alpha/beta fold hydrolase [Streptomyces sp. GS7]
MTWRDAEPAATTPPQPPSGNHWIRRYHTAAPNAPLLLCFPHAGGAASFFRPLSAALTPSIQVLSLQYPGRQDRRTEPPLDSIDALATQAREALPPGITERPWVLLGHSMGALVAFELARRARSTPTGLIVSGRRAPPTHREEYAHLLDDDGLAAEAARHEGPAAHLLADPEIRSAVLPCLRADYTAAETYHYRPGPALPCPMSALTGDRDPLCTVEEATCWKKCTDGSFRLRVFSGAHFFLDFQNADVVTAIREELGAMRAASTDTAPSQSPAVDN